METIAIVGPLLLTILALGAFFAQTVRLSKVEKGARAELAGLLADLRADHAKQLETFAKTAEQMVLAVCAADATDVARAEVIKKDADVRVKLLQQEMERLAKTGPKGDNAPEAPGTIEVKSQPGRRLIPVI